MLDSNRVIFRRQSVLRDDSVPLSDINESTRVFDFTSGDHLYVGSDLPFNHRYFDVISANAAAATVTVDIWNGTGWVAAVDVVDRTASSGVSLAQAGVISWQVNTDVTGWSFDDTDEMDGSGLHSGPKIHGLYWARLQWSATLTTTTALNYIGHRFCSETDLETEYPELASASIKAAWKTGKTNWKDQILTAGEYIIQDLRGEKRLIRSASQILDWENFQKACVHKTAQIIFRGFGDDYSDQFAEAAKAYRQALDVGRNNVDQNADAVLGEAEMETNVSYATR